MNLLFSVIGITALTSFLWKEGDRLRWRLASSQQLEARSDIDMYALAVSALAQCQIERRKCLC